MRFIRISGILTTLIVMTGFLFIMIFKTGKAYQKLHIYIDTQKIIGPIAKNWKALAQGGEEKGVRMLANVIPQVSELYPRYIRIDHVFDFYDVVSRNENNDIVLNWSQLDDTVCDIYHTGAKPFFVIGYMPPAISSDGSLVSLPTSWEDWRNVVKSLVERYSGKNTRICGQVYGEFMNNVYYEVWNEPDLETFGKWSIYGGQKDYKRLYKETVLASLEAENVYNFYIGGPTTTGMYPNWMRQLLRFCKNNNLRIDFISWHRYTVDSDQYSRDVLSLDEVLSEEEFELYRSKPKIISEWGYDSEPNEESQKSKGAAHTAMSIHNLIDQKLEMAFAFEIKDGLTPRWGFLTHDGGKTARYDILRELHTMTGQQVYMSGESDEVRGFVMKNLDMISAMIVNYSPRGSRTVSVPITITGLVPGTYSVNKMLFAGGKVIQSEEEQKVVDGKIKLSILFPADSVLFIKLRSLI